MGEEDRNLNFGDGIIKVVDCVKYLGSILHQSGTGEKDVGNRISQVLSS